MAIWVIYQVHSSLVVQYINNALEQNTENTVFSKYKKERNIFEKYTNTSTLYFCYDVSTI